MYDRLFSYLNHKSILYPSQHGFQSGHSTSMSLLDSHTSPLFLEHKLLNITQIKFLQTCIFMYKYINNLLPPSFFSYFDPAPHLICTRSSNDFRPVFARTNVRKFSLGVQGPTNWNSLPKEIRSVTSLSHFKTLARAHTLIYIS